MDEAPPKPPAAEKGIGTQGRPTLIVLLSILLAAMTTTAAVYQNYIYTQQLDAIQRNVTRGEYIRACRDVIETYFNIKLQVGFITMERAAEPSAQTSRRMHTMEGANVVSRFGALGTYLANFQNEDVRYRYTMLTRELSRIVLAAPQSSETDVDKLFAKADEMFATMNDDCVKSAKAVPLN